MMRPDMGPKYGCWVLMYDFGSDKNLHFSLMTQIANEHVGFGKP